MTDDDPIDLTALLPPDELRVRAIVRDAVAARAARHRAGVFAGLASWTRPMLAAAGIVAALALPTLMRLSVPAPAAASHADNLAASLGIPDPVSQWARSGHEPSTAELLSALGGPDWRTSQ